MAYGGYDGDAGCGCCYDVNVGDVDDDGDWYGDDGYGDQVGDDVIVMVIGAMVMVGGDDVGR